MTALKFDGLGTHVQADGATQDLQFPSHVLIPYPNPVTLAEPREEVRAAVVEPSDEKHIWTHAARKDIACYTERKARENAQTYYQTAIEYGQSSVPSTSHRPAGDRSARTRIAQNRAGQFIPGVKCGIETHIR